MSSRVFRVLIAIGVLGLALIPVTAGTISLSWDSVSHPNLAGYRVYYGTSNNNYSASVDVGITNQATLPGLTNCTTYYLAVKARGSDGSLSPTFSNQISGWARPELVSDNLTSISSGGTAQLLLTGANFMPGASLTFDNPGISVTSITVTCSLITADLSVAAGAASGNVNAEVTNPDNVFGAGSNLFAIVGDTAGPLLSGINAGLINGTSSTVTWQTDEPADSRVFYRKQGEPAWRPTALDDRLVTSHAIALTGLIPQTGYEYYVASTDGAGNASDSSASPRSFTTAPSSFTYLRFEAEAGSMTSPITVAGHTEAFEGEFIRLASGESGGTPANPRGTATYGFHAVESGSWTVWLRMWSQSPGSDEWMEAVDGAALAVVRTASEDTWEWVEGRTYALSAGLHTLRLGGVEDRVRVDRLLITNDPEFLPTEGPGADNSAPGPATALQGVPGDAANNLQWTNPGNADVTRVVVRYQTDGVFPVSPVAGLPALDRAASPSAAESLVHGGLTNGTTYSYSVFVLDAAGNVSDRVTVALTPEAPAEPLGTVQNVQRNDVH